jgi:hypothetical protein
VRAGDLAEAGRGSRGETLAAARFEIGRGLSPRRIRWGGAIAVFSDPEAECEETLMKAAALHRVLETGVCATGLADSAVASA